MHRTLVPRAGDLYDGSDASRRMSAVGRPSSRPYEEKHAMSYTRIVALTSLAMIAFAGNSLLCRVALKNTGIDAASFTTVRLISGAVMLWLESRW
jgi:hypothetical protein